jgi:hypothetical protein
MATNRHANQTDVNVHTPFRQVFADSTARLADATVYVAGDINKLALQVDTNEQYRLSSFSPTTWTSIGSSSTAISPYSGGSAGYSSAPNLVQDASADTSNIGPVIYGPTGTAPGGPYWTRVTDGTHPIRGKLRRGILDATTGFTGTGWWTVGDGSIFLTYVSGVGYQIAFSSVSGATAALQGSPVAVEEWPWEEVNANANIVTFRVSVDSYRWKTLFTIDVTVAPYSTATTGFSGFFVQGTDTELLIERSDVQ